MSVFDERPQQSPTPTERTDSSCGMLLSPGFRSAAAMAGWDEEALLLATVVVEDTPVRESRQHKRRRLRTPLSTTSTRKRAPRRKPAVSIPPVVLRLDDDDDDEEQAADRGGETTNKETEAAVAVDGAKQIDKEGSLSEKAPVKGLPCMDRLREELSCAICLEICFEPSTTPCGHSFCIKCLKSAANKCGKRCPKCRQLISNARSCTINTVLWNTVQLLFPEEVETRKSSSSAVAATPPGGKTQSSSCEQNNSNTNISSRRSIRRSAAQASSSQVTERDTRSLRRRIGPSQSEDAAMALRLQREEFRVAFQGSREQQLRALRYARANLRAAASMTVHGRLRGRAT